MHTFQSGIRGGVSFIGRRYCEQSLGPDDPAATRHLHSYVRCIMLFLGELGDMI